MDSIYGKVFGKRSMNCDFDEARLSCNRCGFSVTSLPSFRNCTGGTQTAASQSGGGPGTHLSGLLLRLGISYTPGCSCADRAKTMDSWGPDICEQRLDEIVGWLREEAEKRGLPFFATVARLLVKRAIAKARKTTLE